MALWASRCSSHKKGNGWMVGEEEETWGGLHPDGLRNEEDEIET